MIENKVLSSFGSRIRQIRSKRSISQENLALSSNLDRTYISSVERGLRNLSILNIYRLAAALNVCPSSLLQDKPEENEEPRDKLSAAFAFYRQHIYRPSLFDLLGSHKLKIPGCVPSVVWELFGSVLTNSMGTVGYGTDLEGLEVKSAKEGSGFEYQYHLRTGLDKLNEDKNVDHLFCIYSTDYREVTVYRISGSKLSDKFEEWIPQYKENYKETTPTKRKQRFRRSISAARIKTDGKIVMQICDAQLQT